MPVSPVLRQTRASCAAWRSAEELCGSTGTSFPTRLADVLNRRLPELILLVALALGSAGCGVTGDAAEVTDDEDVADPADPALRFDDAASSLDELARQVLLSLARKDTSELDAFRLTEFEHNEIVWPELPASAPEVNFPIDYAWSNIQNRNARGLARLLPAFESRRPGFRSTDCRGETEMFETFEVRTDCWIVFTVGEGPAIWEIQAFKDVIVRGGGFKIFRYYDEEPRAWRGPASR